jgi:hypothetical protein
VVVLGFAVHLVAPLVRLLLAERSEDKLLGGHVYDVARTSRLTPNGEARCNIWQLSALLDRHLWSSSGHTCRRIGADEKPRAQGYANKDPINRAA